jgi:hypothetical protein
MPVIDSRRLRSGHDRAKITTLFVARHSATTSNRQRKSEREGGGGRRGGEVEATRGGDRAFVRRDSIRDGSPGAPRVKLLNPV